MAPQTRITLRYIPGSTRKLEQLIGERDKQRGELTRNRSWSRHGVAGTDLGSSFEHNGRLVLLFGDTIGKKRGDALAYSDSRDPESGLVLDFPRAAGGGYLTVRPDGQEMRGFEVPVAGVSINGQPYLFCKRNHNRGQDTDATSLVKFNEKNQTFTTVRPVSRRPEGTFVKVSVRLAPGPVAGLPGQGERLLIWGTGAYRRSSCYLSTVGAADIEKPGKTLYFSGLDPSGKPSWSQQERAAVPVVDHETMGDVSVTWVAALGRWLMVYDSRQPRGILLRHAAKPWGPWSKPQLIFNARRDRALGTFIHLPGSGDGLAGPVVGQRNRQNPEAVRGGAYAPYVVERFTRVQGDELTMYYLMSTWNPYVVVLMTSRLSIERSPASSGQRSGARQR